MEKDRDMGQANKRAVCCCKCYWNDQCCSGCGIEQEDCDDFTPLFADGVDELDYIEQEYLKDLDERAQGYEKVTMGHAHTWSDCITVAWLRGEDVSSNEWWR